MPTLAEILATRTPPSPAPQPAPLPPARPPALAPALKALPSVPARTPATPRPVGRYRTETMIWRTGRVERIRVFEGALAGEETAEIVSLFHPGGPNSPCYVDPDDPPPAAAA